MSSFDRQQYRKVFQFAKLIFFQFESRDEDFEFEAAEIMEMVEGVIGQQSDFPDEAREVLKENTDDADLI